ncbi:HTH-type transcriptional repressor KstR2 [compost metagenome]
MGAALTMFTRKGITACKMGDIAKEAGLSHGHVYNHFASKEELLKVIVFESQDSYTRLLERVLCMEGTIPERLQWLARTYLADQRSDKPYWVILQAQATDLLSGEAKEIIRQRMQENLQRLTSIIRQGQEEGSVMEGDPEEIALMITTFLGSISLWEIRGFKQTWETSVKYIRKLIQK